LAHIKAKEVNTVPITVVGVEDVKIRDAQEEEGDSMGDTEKVVAVVEVMIHHRPPPLYHLQSGTP